MELKIKLFLLISISLGCQAKIKLPILSTKQPIRNIRFISKGGTYTYFQNNSGELSLSYNYQARSVIKGRPGSHFLFHSSSARKYLIFTMDQNYHDYLGLRKSLEIYKLRFGKIVPENIGYGQLPKLHLNDTWVSYYNFQDNILRCKSTHSKLIEFSIPLKNKINPFFRPQIEMVDKQNIIYTDLDKKGFPIILRFDRGSNKALLLYKAKTFQEKLEICFKQDRLFIGSFGLEESSRGSSIVSFTLKKDKLIDPKQHYSSQKNDYGNLICHFKKNHIYFVKNLTKEIKIIHEAVELNTSSNKLKVLSNIKNANQIIVMDDKLLLPSRDFIYVLVGHGNFKLDTMGKKETSSK
jgi:hypothetical protein